MAPAAALLKSHRSRPPVGDHSQYLPLKVLRLQGEQRDNSGHGMNHRHSTCRSHVLDPGARRLESSVTAFFVTSGWLVFWFVGLQETNDSLLNFNGTQSPSFYVTICITSIWILASFPLAPGSPSMPIWADAVFNRQLISYPGGGTGNKISLVERVGEKVMRKGEDPSSLCTPLPIPVTTNLCNNTCAPSKWFPSLANEDTILSSFTL